MRVLLDTGPLVALLNRRDQYHAWSVEQARPLAPPFFCCEAVLTEAHFLLAGVHQGTERLISLIDSNKLDLSFHVADHTARVGDLMRSYADVPMSFADACLVAMCEQQESILFTTDSDFRRYRKHRREALDLIIP